MVDDIYSKIYGPAPTTNGGETTPKKGKQKHYNLEEGEEKVNIAVPLTISLVCLVIGVFAFLSLLLQYSYDFCIIMDTYYVYVASVLALALFYDIFVSIKGLKQRFNLFYVINLVLCIVGLLVFVLPFAMGNMIYFRF